MVIKKLVFFDARMSKQEDAYPLNSTEKLPPHLVSNAADYKQMLVRCGECSPPIHD